MIATGLAGGATGTRIIEQLTAEAILCDFVRIGEESRTSTAVIDPTSGVQTEINEIGPEVTESEISLFCDKLHVPRQGRRHLRVRRQPAARRRRQDLRRADHRAEAARRHDGDRRRGRADGAGAARRRPTSCRRTRARRSSSSATSSATTPTTSSRSTSSASAGPREAIITHAEGCYALVGRDHERSLYELRIDPLEPVSAIGAGDVFLAGYLAARYTGRPHADALRFAVACGAESTLHLGAGVLDPRAAERLEHEVALDRAREAARSTPRR